MNEQTSQPIGREGVDIPGTHLGRDVLDHYLIVIHSVFVPRFNLPTHLGGNRVLRPHLPGNVRRVDHEHLERA